MSEWRAVGEFAAAWAVALGRASWQGGVAIGLAWAVCRTLPRLPGAAQCWAWRVAYLKLLVALVWTSPVSLPLLPAPPAISVSQVTAVPVREIGEAAPLRVALPAAAAGPVGAMQRPDRPQRSSPGSWAIGLLVSWCIGVACCVLRVQQRWRRTRRLIQACEAVEDSDLQAALSDLCRRLGLRERPRLVTGDTGMPLCAAGPRPAIILPRALLPEATPQELRLVIAHELAHLKRRDLLWSWLPVGAHCLFFFHPLVWLAHSPWRLAQEMACDEMAVRVTGSPVADYGGLLLRLAERCRERGRWGFSAVGALEPGAALERRIDMLNHVTQRPRRLRFATGALLTALALLALVPWQVSARGGDEPAAGSALAQKWEDVLLLEAIHYLRLSPAQLRQIQPLADAARSHLDRLQVKERKTRAALDRIAEKQREALVKGGGVSLQEQTDALHLEKTMKQRREEAADEITRQLAPRFARILTRPQIEAAYLLAHCEMPKDVPPRPALLDPASGFVIETGKREENRMATIQQILRRRYPAQMVEAGMTRGWRLDFDTGSLRLRPENGLTVATNPGLVIGIGEPDHEKLQEFPAEQREAFLRERQALEEGWHGLAQSLLGEATVEELAGALEPLARRMFLSPRLVPVLAERLQRAAGSAY